MKSVSKRTLLIVCVTILGCSQREARQKSAIDAGSDLEQPTLDGLSAGDGSAGGGGGGGRVEPAELWPTRAVAPAFTMFPMVARPARIEAVRLGA